MTDYNGWPNRETWLVSLWFGDYLASRAEEGETLTADDIRDMIEEHVDSFGVPSSGFIRDMLFLGSIDYARLAHHYNIEDDLK